MKDYTAYGYKGLLGNLKAMFLPKPPSTAMLALELVYNKNAQVRKPSDSLQERLEVASQVKLGFWKRWLGYERALKEAIVDGWVVNVRGEYFFTEYPLTHPATKP